MPPPPPGKKPRSVLSQILSGLAYAFGGLFLLVVVVELLPRPGPIFLVPPYGVHYIKTLHTALETYAMDHEGRYPATLGELELIDSPYAHERKARRDLLTSTNLSYLPPAPLLTEPASARNQNTIILAYEDQEWTATITIGGEHTYQRKNQKSPVPRRQQLPATAPPSPAQQ